MPAWVAPTSCREFFGQGWMKLEKNERTPYIMKTTKHFNDVSDRRGFLGRTLRPSPGVLGCGLVLLRLSLSFSPYQGGWPQEGTGFPGEGAPLGAPFWSLQRKELGREEGGPHAVLLIFNLIVLSEASTLSCKISDFPLNSA